MNFFNKAFLLIVSVMLLTACDNTHHVNTQLFSLDTPTGYLDEPAEENEIISAVSISSIDGNNVIVTFGALYQDSAESLLSMQIKENFSTTIPGLNIGAPYMASIAGIEALVSDCDGTAEGETVSGKIYAFTRPPLTFVVLAIGTKGTPDATEKVIASITPNKEYLDSIFASPEAEVDLLINLARKNGITDNSEEIDIAEIRTDHVGRKITYVMSLPGTADDYADLAENVAANHRETAGSLHDGYTDDPSLSVPLRHGYSICYEYVLYGTDKVIATDTFIPEEIM